MSKAKPHSQDKNPIAIVGMGCIFPGAGGLKHYWRLLSNGQDAISPVPEDTHWKLSDYYSKDKASPDHTCARRGGFLPPTAFDPLRYGMPPNNLQATDTSQLFGLLVAEMALQDAGMDPAGDMDRSRVSVILGVTGTQELVIPLGARLGHPIWKQALEDSGIPPEKQREILTRMAGSFVPWQENSFPGLLGNVVAGRIANRLDFGGTNAVVDAACASSLGALNAACLELETGRCDISITGGVDTLNDIFMHICFSSTGVLSPTSDARPFSKDADGTVLGEGVGMLILKRLSDARRDQDRIYALIKGVGSASDGKTGGIYAPDASGQIKALKRAYRQAGIQPNTVGLIEAHGTGTRVGDAVEVKALKQLMDTSSGPADCALGSVKSMIGHTKAAAGIAGTIKAVLSLYHKVLPPTLKAETPDPELPLKDSGLYLNPSAMPWPLPADHPRRCGVSAFGFGGSNFHVVLEEYTSEKQHVSWDGRIQIAGFSAPSPEGLIQKMNVFTRSLADISKRDSRESDEAIALGTHTLRNTFDHSHSHRLALLLKADDHFIQRMQRAVNLVEADPGTSRYREDIYYGNGPGNGKLAFVFPGQGSQYPAMGRDLLVRFPEGLQALELADEVFSTIHGDAEAHRLSRYLFPPPAHVQDPNTAAALLRETHRAQPAIGAVSLAMMDILKRFDITPEAACGHSFGELCALYASGAISRRDLLHLAARRGQYMAKSPETGTDPGGMLAVQAPIERVVPLIQDEFPDLILANLNSPRQCVLSGPSEMIAAAAVACRKKKIRSVVLPVAAAFHSPLVAHASTPFKVALEAISFNTPAIDVYANRSADPYPADDPQKARQLLADQMTHPVRFQELIQNMAQQGVATFLEVGPKNVLSGLIRHILTDTPHQCLALDVSSGRSSGTGDLARVLCRLAALGYPVNLSPWETPPQTPEPKGMRITITGANPPHHPADPLPPSYPKPPADKKSPHVEARPLTGTDSNPVPAEKKTPQGATFPASSSSPSPGVCMTPLDPLAPVDRSGSKPDHDPSSPPANRQSSPVSAPQQTENQTRQAIGLVQSGLDALKALQAETTRAHETFLATQADAGRILERMLADTRRFAGQLIHAPVAHDNGHDRVSPSLNHTLGKADTIANGHQQASAPPVSRTSPLPPPPTTHPLLQKKSAVLPRTRHSITEAPSHLPLVETETPQSNPSRESIPDTADGLQDVPSAENTDLRSELTACVSRLTGFPEEMLEMEMSLSSDLGIDSIKRVEIMSELEKTLPNSVAGISPDTMARIQTLKDILVLLQPENKRAHIETDPTHTEPLNGEATDINGPILDLKTTDLFGLLIAVVNELTGFPEEMLTPDMDLASDLGIDSIKRVEILSRLEQQFPETLSFSAEEISGLNTLGDLASRLSSKAGHDADPAETGDKHSPPECRSCETMITAGPEADAKKNS